MRKFGGGRDSEKQESERGQKKDRDMEGRRGKPSQRPAFQVNSYLTILVPMVAKCVCVGHLKGEFENNA